MISLFLFLTLAAQPPQSPPELHKPDRGDASTEVLGRTPVLAFTPNLSDWSTHIMTDRPKTFQITPESNPDIWALLQPPERQLTAKEQKVVDALEKSRPGLGDIAKANILNPNSDWAEQIAQMPEEEIVARTAFVPNSFSYRHIGY